MLHAPSPSRFAIVSLLVLLMLGVGVNLYISLVGKSTTHSLANKSFSTASPSPSDPVRWPTIPDEIIDKLGSPTRWIQSTQNTYRFIEIQWGEYNEKILDWDILLESRFGVPFTARSMKNVFSDRSNTIVMTWPMEGGKYVGPAVTYHPLGLIINPIVYALPTWLVVLFIRHILHRNKLRKRIAQGLCSHCAYDIQDLPICPECGHAVMTASETPVETS